MLVTLTSRGWTTKGVLLRKHCRLLTVERYINLLFDADRTNAHAKETHTESALSLIAPANRSLIRACLLSLS